ncbi:MAG TPA: glycosyltransferase [Polyangia bacterium]|jgi:dolichol-phosphate mannosyltransferase|nr:glycosyltransferase [Polyangia bacterium]
MGGPKTLLAIPTYNEVGNVEPLCLELLGQELDLDILFMDDASPDGTGALIDRLAAEHTRILGVHRAGKLGIGSAHLDCVAYAYDHGYDVLITMDCDFTHPPSAVSSLIALSVDFDVVVGSRYLVRDSLQDWTVFRRMLTYGGHFLTRRLLNLEQDASSGMRLYQLRSIPRALFGLIDARGYSFFFESLYVLVINGYRVGEVGIRLPARASGHSKMTPKDAAEGLLRLGRIWLLCKLNPSKYRAGV